MISSRDSRALSAPINLSSDRERDRETHDEEEEEEQEQEQEQEVKKKDEADHRALSASARS